MSFRRGRPESSGGRIGVLTFLPSVPPAEIGTGNPITGTRGETLTVTRSTARSCKTSADGSTVSGVPANTPALEPAGLSIEATHTNRCQQSEAPATSPWILRGSVSVTNNALLAPDGTTTGALVAGLSAVSTADFYQIISGFFGGASVTQSFWIKRVSSTGLLSISNSSVGGAGGLWIINMALLPDAWTRIIPGHAALTITTPFVANGGGAAGPDFFCGTGAPLSFYIWGIQSEESAYPRSYIPTAGLVGTRNQDIAILSGAASLPLSRGQVEVDFTPNWSGNGNGTMVETRSTATSGGLALYVQNGTLTFDAKSAGSNAQAVGLGWTAGTTYRIKGAWSADGVLRLWRDGALVATSVADIPNNVPTLHSTIRIGSNFLGGFPPDANFKNLRFYK